MGGGGHEGKKISVKLIIRGIRGFKVSYYGGPFRSIVQNKRSTSK